MLVHSDSGESSSNGGANNSGRKGNNMRKAVL